MSDWTKQFEGRWEKRDSNVVSPATLEFWMEEDKESQAALGRDGLAQIAWDRAHEVKIEGQPRPQSIVTDWWDKKPQGQISNGTAAETPRLCSIHLFPHPLYECRSCKMRFCCTDLHMVAFKEGFLERRCSGCLKEKQNN